jgi:hypothetical protein
MKKLITGLIIAMLANASNAQSIGPATLNTAGGQGSISGNTFEYNFGEMVNTQTMSNANFIITHGTLQPFYFSPESIDDQSVLTDLITILPTISTNSFLVNIEAIESGKVSCFVYNAVGKVIKQEFFNKNSNSTTYQLDLDGVAAAEYYVLITIKNTTTKYTTFKIQKI